MKECGKLGTFDFVSKITLMKIYFSTESSLAGDEELPKIDYDKMMENIKDLNVLAGDGISRIQRTTDGARLKVRTFKLKISQLPSMICYRYIHKISKVFIFKLCIGEFSSDDAYLRIVAYFLHHHSTVLDELL